MTSPAECLNMAETVNRLRRIIDDPHSHNGYPVVEDYCPSSVRIKVEVKVEAE